jgi:hypothetical protein
VGYDLDYSNNTNVYWDSLGTFVTSKLNGTLLIRPVVKGGNRVETGRKTKDSAQNRIRIYPNPSNEGRTVYFQWAGTNLQQMQADLYDLNGKIVYRFSETNPESNIRVQLPHALPAGCYRWKIQGQSLDGLPFFQSLPWIVQP